ncbi:MAG: DNA translocase FtsK 4TM domain-containing protein [Porphyromonadaceae bacterium]
MVKKKKEQKPQTLMETVGFKNIFRNYIFNFLFGLVFVLVAVFMIIAFISYFSTGDADQSLVSEMRHGDWLNSNKEFQNICGSIGAIISDFFIARCFGFAAFSIPIFICLTGLSMMKVYKVNLLKWFLCLSIITVWCSVAFAEFLSIAFENGIFNPGGGHGLYISQWVENVIGIPGLYVVLLFVAIAFLTYLSTETIEVLRKALNPANYLSNRVKFTITNLKKKTDDIIKEDDEQDENNINVYDDPAPQTVDFTDDGIEVHTPVNTDIKGGTNKHDSNNTGNANEPEIEITVGDAEEKAASKTVVGKIDLTTPINPKEPWTKYKYPTLDLLKKYDDGGKVYVDEKEQLANKKRIVDVLATFGVQIKSIKATVGPTITLYEITPAEGVRISRIRGLEDDIALSLSALGIRIIAPIPGKGAIGIEVPNAKPNIVSMESILNSRKFQETKMELPIALGKTITNEVYMVDLAKIPHLLVAGATGQGKSVGLNAIITSLLYKKHPNELKFVLIDPKKVEFSIYNPIVNHFLAKVPDDNEEPIITDVTKVIRTLNSLCALMDNRYNMLRMATVRNIKEYNAKFVNHQLDLTKGHEYMPYIVVIIDEFGDLIMTAGKEIEMPIARIAQLARAVGIHMVIATQRPTTSIITGNIKANFPGRMAFKVSAMIDSRTILDQKGAEQLIGRGDMLILNGSTPVRVQCAFVDTPEVENINTFIKNQQGPVIPMELPEPASDEIGIGSGTISTDDLDPLFIEVARFITINQQGSTSMIQRHFSIGYNRAGRLMDQMEKIGIVGTAQGSKPREVLISDENSLNTLLAGIHR